MNVIRWEPFREVDEMLRQYSPLFSRALRRNRGEAGEWTPVADISETEQEYVIKAELPEVKKEDVKVTLDNGIMTIAGERKYQKEQNDARERGSCVAREIWRLEKYAYERSATEIAASDTRPGCHCGKRGRGQRP